MVSHIFMRFPSIGHFRTNINDPEAIKLFWNWKVVFLDPSKSLILSVVCRHFLSVWTVLCVLQLFWPSWWPRSWFIEYLLKYGPINNKTALVDMMAWRRLGDKPLSESIMAISPVTHTVIGQSHDNAMGRDISCVCWVYYRTQYCWIFMKLTENNGNVNATLSAKYETNMLEIVSNGSYPAGLILILGSRINIEENNLAIFSSGHRAHKSNSWLLVASESFVIGKKQGYHIES